jgi:hypothetical protein
MAMTLDVNLVMQMICLSAAIFGIVCAVIRSVEILGDLGSHNWGALIAMIFVVIFCLFLLLVEVHVFNFLKYFAFLLTVWGKAIMYIFLGLFLYESEPLGLAAAIIFWFFFVLFIVLVFIGARPAPPLTQKTNPPNFETHSEKYFEDSELPQRTGEKAAAPSQPQ